MGPGDMAPEIYQRWPCLGEVEEGERQTGDRAIRVEDE